MKIKELLADQLARTSLFEMAYERKNAMMKVDAIEKPLNEHLIKYFYFEDHAKNHWLSEILSFISVIDDIYLKPKSSKLSAKIYYQYLFEHYYGHGDNVLVKKIQKLVKIDYSDCERTGLSYQQLWWAMKQFYLWLCPLLENDKYEEFDVKRKLEELGVKAKKLQ